MILLNLLHPQESLPAQSWTFEDETVIRVGRANDNHVVLYSAVVSRYHVELRQVETGWEIVSLGANGTYVDGDRVSQIPVTDGVIFRLARSGPQIQVRLELDTAAHINQPQEISQIQHNSSIPQTTVKSGYDRLK
ncbi:MAG: FHA domain-containing protein [Methylacidiphilales bacterium]|nr:FHA domain-containing protein [Candidatus Methylacidiphilales bacterium]NJR15402.1 FHA domain-containing protein [Calothrix sp. CSU_2_0]